MKLKTLLVGAVAGLLLTACGGGASPKDVTTDFVNAMAAGDCDKALGMAVENAAESVETSKAAGCKEYESEIVSVDCETTEETAACSCKEKKDGTEQTFDYDLKKVDGEWKVSNFQKSMNMEGMEDLGM